MLTAHAGTQSVYRGSLIPPPSDQRAAQLLARDIPRTASGPDCSEAKRFYEDAQRYLERTDDCPYTGSFFQLRPTYQNLSDEQLRGYFTWRTGLRAGSLENAPLPFALLYSYELINLVGVSSPLEGFLKLSAFRERFSAFNPAITSVLNRCLLDFVLTYDLAPQLITPILSMRSDENGLLTLSAYARQTLNNSAEIDLLFDCLKNFSSYKIERSAFFQEKSAQLKSVVAHAFQTLWRTKAMVYGVHRVIGEVSYSDYMPFKGTILYRKAPWKDGVHPLENGDCYCCQDNHWQVGRWYLPKNDKRLAAFLKCVESRLRRALGYKHALQESALTEGWSPIIDQAIASFRKDERAERIASVSIDHSKLDAIRKAALSTQNKLIVEEEEQEAKEITYSITTDTPKPIQSDTLEAQHQRSEKADETTFPLLTPQETSFLRHLLQDPSSHGKSVHGLSSDLLSDAINEKLFDLFSDTVLIYEGDHFVIPEDYRPKVEELLAS